MRVLFFTTFTGARVRMTFRFERVKLLPRIEAQTYKVQWEKGLVTC